MKIKFYKVEDLKGKMMKFERGEYIFPLLKIDEDLRIFNDEVDFDLGEIKKYQFLANMLYVETTTGRYFFDIICD